MGGGGSGRSDSGLRLSGHHRPSDLHQVGRDNSPAHPAPHPVFPMVPTAIQFVAAVQHADASFDAGAEPEAPPEPPFAFPLLSLGGCPPLRGEDYSLDARLAGQLLIPGGGDPTVTGQEPGRVPEALLVISQALSQIGIILPRLLQDAVAADDPSLHLLQPELAPELSGLAGLVPLDELGVRLEETDDLLSCRHFLSTQHPALCLPD